MEGHEEAKEPLRCEEEQGQARGEGREQNETEGLPEGAEGLAVVEVRREGTKEPRRCDEETDAVAPKPVDAEGRRGEAGRCADEHHLKPASSARCGRQQRSGHRLELPRRRRGARERTQDREDQVVQQRHEEVQPKGRRAARIHGAPRAHGEADPQEGQRHQHQRSGEPRRCVPPEDIDPHGKERREVRKRRPAAPRRCIQQRGVDGVLRRHEGDARCGVEAPTHRRFQAEERRQQAPAAARPHGVRSAPGRCSTSVEVLFRRPPCSS